MHQNTKLCFTKNKKIIDLLRTLSESLSKNWKLNLKLIELVLIFCEACKKVRLHVYPEAFAPLI